MTLYAFGDTRPALDNTVWIAPNATVIGAAHFGPGSSVWWGTVVRADDERIDIGARTNIQDNSVLHADPGVPLVLGDDVSIGHMAMLHGCTVGQGSLIGIKAVILNKAVIGKECLIGANTLIPEGKVIPDRSLVVGSPGRIVRTLTDAEVARLYAIAQHYVDSSELYRTRLTPLD